MSNLSDLFFNFRGRINRKPYWLGTLGLSLFLMMIVMASLVATGLPAPGEVEPNLPTWVYLLMLPLYWPIFAMLVKRLHDRNKSAWWLLVFMVLPFVLQITAAALFLSNIPSGPGAAGVDPSAIGLEAVSLPVLALYAVSVAISLWFLVEVGFLRGTQGPNDYGDDPLAAPRVA